MNNFEVNIPSLNDSPYVLGGFRPISIRIIEKGNKRQLGLFTERCFKNPGLEYDNPSDERLFMFLVKNFNFILLVFLGGITDSETDAVR